MADSTHTIADGRYELIEPIGHGATGAVHRARQASVGRHVAVKLLRADLCPDGPAAARFAREAEAISRIRHPSVVQLIDAGSWNGRAFIVTELLSGRSLASLLAERPIEPSRTVWLLREVADALVVIHEAGVVHRDLKPSNLFIECVAGRDLLKIVDFGISRIEGQPALTTTGEVVGTPIYMSPEQIRGEDLAGKSDIYSLGVIAYECLAGRPPFVGGSSPSLMLMHLEDRPPPFAELARPVAVPAGLEDLIMEMLSKHPDDRPSADTLRTLLTTDLEASWRAAPVAVHIRSDRPVLSPDERARFERRGYAVTEREAEVVIARAPADALNSSRSTELPPATIHVVDATVSDLEPEAIRGRSVVIGPLPLDGSTLGAAVGWLRSPSTSILETLAAGAPVRSVVLRDSSGKAGYAAALTDDLERRRLPKHVVRSAERAADELMMNAFFHAPVDELGRTLHSSRDRASPVVLHYSGQQATLAWFAAERFVAVGVSDPFGSLDSADVIACAGGEGFRPRGLGAGLGLRTVLASSAEMVVAIHPRLKTEILAVIPPEPRGRRRPPSLWLLSGGVAGAGDDPRAERIGAELLMRATDEGDRKRVTLEGKIDETSDLARPLSLGPVLVLDLGAVRQINSAGVLRWINAWDAARTSTRVTLERCPPDIVEQLSSVAQFGDGMSIASVLVPYYCATCRTEVLELVREDGRDAVPASQACRCGGRLELAESPLSYFSVWK